MKKYLLMFSLMAGCSAPAFALSVGDLVDDLQENVKLTVLQSASPMYLYNARKGQSEAGVETSVFTYRFLTLDLGYSTPMDASLKGTILGGASLHIDQIISTYLPTFTTFASTIIPGPMQKFWNKLFFGAYVGRNIDDNQADYGLKTGLSVTF